MKPKTKKFLSNFFIGLFSNDQAIEGSKSNPWWVALIIAIFSVIIPVIPLTVAQANSYGSSFVSNYSYRLDTNLTAVTKDLALNNKEFKVNDNKFLDYYVDGALTNLDETADNNPIVFHKNSINQQYELVVYYTQREDKALVDYVTNIDGLRYQLKTTTVVTDSEADTAQLYSPSYLILHKKGLIIALRKEDSVTSVSNGYLSATDWQNFEVGTEIIKSALPEGVTADQVDVNNTEHINAMFKTWKTYFDKAFITQKNYNILMTSLVFLGIYTGLVFILGLLVFVLTRGKNNMFNYLKFIDCQKIVWWAVLSPAILATIFGFIFTNFAQMIFIILVGLRTMWISMKQLRPQY